LSVLGIVEPEAQVERVGRWQSHVRIETEDLIGQNGLDAHAALVMAFADLGQVLAGLSAGLFFVCPFHVTNDNPAGQSTHQKSADNYYSVLGYDRHVVFFAA
jgi:hypothetical protein